MNVTTGKIPLATLKGFKGMYSRGVYDTCPPDHFTDCYNCIFTSGQVTIREPVTVQSRIAGRSILSYFIAKVSTGARLITLSSDGYLRDETLNTVLIALAPGTVDDFSALNIFGRTYISLKYKGYPFNGTLFYYDGTVFAPAAGGPPPGVLTATTPDVGVVDVGTHKIAISWITSTGFLTPPGPTINVVADGSHDIVVDNIAIGPPGSHVVGKVILMSPADQTELFFVPGGTINDNSTTSFTINVHDSTLIESADYLYNLMTGIPNGSALRFYRGRLVIVGQVLSPDILLVSRLDDPESFDQVTGAINFPVDYGLNTSNTAAIIRDVVYVMKPNGTYSTQDNGGDPNTWSVTIIDSGLGAYDNGLSLFASSMSGSDVLDTAFVLHPRGLLLFDGTYNPTPLTYKIQGIWDMIANSSSFYQCQVAHDVFKRRVYISIPLSPPSQLGTDVQLSQYFQIILMMDYQDGLDPMSVKWSVWTSTNFLNSISKMMVENFTLVYPPPTGTVPIYQLSFCTGGDTIYKVILPQSQITQAKTVPYIGDNTFIGTMYPINQYVVLSINPASGGVYCFTMLDLNIYGYGNLSIMLMTKAKSLRSFYSVFNLGYYLGGIRLQRLINITSESLFIALQADQGLPGSQNGFFQLVDVDVYGNKMYTMRPALLELY